MMRAGFLPRNQSLCQSCPSSYTYAELNKTAVCFALFVDGQPASFAGMPHCPHPTVKDIKRCSRLVTLPDWQRLGLAMILIQKVGVAYKSMNKRVHT